MLDIHVQKQLAHFQLSFQEMFFPGVTAIFGMSGAGKTSLLNMIAGLDRPDTGKIVLNQITLFDSTTQTNLPPEKRNIGYVFQESHLFPHLKVKNNLIYGYQEVSQETSPLNFSKVVELLDLAPLLFRRTHRLSTGEKQRVAIGRALLTHPQLLLMDEPLASLDGQRKVQILPFLKRICNELNIPILYVSHAIDEIMHLANRMVFIVNGTCQAHGSLTEVLAHHKLQEFYGLKEVGSILETTVLQHDSTYGLTELQYQREDYPHTPIFVPKLEVMPSQSVRIRILPRDVALSYTRPIDSSVLNIFQGTVIKITQDNPTYADVLLDVKSPLWARITHKSRERLNLQEGKQVYALIKSVAVIE